MIKLIHGDCLEKMAEIEDGSIDMVLADPPYGTTACKWDSIIPMEPMWGHLKRLIRPSGAIVMTASQPFTSVLVASNLRGYKHRWVWDKVKPGSGLCANLGPLRNTEDVLVFADSKVAYSPQMTPKKRRKEDKFDRNGEAFGNARTLRHHDNKGWGYPKEIITISNANQKGRVHPTQKPVALMEYLIKTYTNEGETVLDFTMGSGTTGVACKNLNRSFVGIEMDDHYFKVASDRINQQNQTGQERKSSSDPNCSK